uniref:Putative transposase (Putative), gypsy type n=1 Tax=Tanacetum cinerariifolium TaxID=118510 RepID=A0A6L2KCS1_TANCI|nr:putative transposase (putative), gypsy type [Tanacetum cinerariifolium]
MTIDRLLSRYIGLYVEQLEQEGLKVPFSSFFLAVIKHFGVHVSQLVPMGVNRVILFESRCLSLDVWPIVSLFLVFYKLCKQGHWFSFENKTGRGTRKCFKEVTTSLKGWKRKFFLIDRRAISDAMPWRHGDTDLHDKFPSNFNQDDVERLSEFLLPLRPPPCHLLYVCGLTTACRHPGLSYSIKDQDKNVINMDTFLKLPTWTGTIVSKGDPILEDQRPKPRAGGSRKKQKVHKQNEPTQSGSEDTLSANPIHQAHPEAAKKHATVIPPEVAQGGPHVKKEVVDLSAQSHQSSHQGHELVDNRYVPNWELRNDLRVCTYRVCRELVNHVATPACSSSEMYGDLL